MTRHWRDDARSAPLCCVPFVTRLLVAGLCIACAGAPAPSAPAPSAPAPSAPAQAQGEPLADKTRGAAAADAGTALKPTATPLSPALAERRAIEFAIVLASPKSLSEAFSLIGTSKALKLDEARSLAWIAARIAGLVYPEAAEELVPADLRNQGETPATPLARFAGEAAAGRPGTPEPALEGQPLAELVPALALFRSESRETARRALEGLERFARLGAVSALPGIVRGLDAERRKDWQGALGFYAEALSVAGDAYPASAGRARAFLATNRPAEALAELDAALSLRPSASDYATLRRARAEAYYRLGRFAEAEPLVIGVLREDPLDSGFVLMRAHLLTRARAYQQALPLLDAYATVDPGNRRYLLLRTLVAEGLKSRDEALKWARRGLTAYPDDPEFLAAAARLLFAAPLSLKLELRDAALAEGRELARRTLDAGRVEPGSTLAPLEAQLKGEAIAEAARLLLLDAVARYDWTTALSLLDRAKTAPGFDARALSGLVLRKSGEWGRALEEAAAWYREAPESEEAIAAYARALIGAKSDKAAQELITRHLAGKTSPSFRSTLLYLQGVLAKNEEAALGFFRSSLVENADNGEALVAMYDLYYRRKEYQRARFYLKQALAIAPEDPELKRRARELEAAGP